MKHAPFFLALALSALSLHAQTDTPSANPSRPTVTNPAVLPPVGYLQFENGYLSSIGSPSTDAIHGINQVTKIALNSRTLVQAQFQPFAFTKNLGDTHYDLGSGDILLGIQGVAYMPHGSTTANAPKPKLSAFSVGYFGRVHAGDTGNNDEGSYANSVLLLFSGDVLGIHYDTNYLFVEQTNGPVRRFQNGQTLALSHTIRDPRLDLYVELDHFSQPFVPTDDCGRSISRANAVDILVAPTFTLRPNLVLDGGFSHGFTASSTQWQAFAGFTYLLPHRLWPERKH